MQAVQWQQHGDHPDVYRIPGAPETWGYIKTERGEVCVRTGWWIVTDQDGPQVMTQEEFTSMYDPANA